MLTIQESEDTFTRQGVLVGMTLVDLQRERCTCTDDELSQHVQRGTPLAMCKPVLSVLQTVVKLIWVCRNLYTFPSPPCMRKLSLISLPTKANRCIPCCWNMLIFSLRGQKIWDKLIWLTTTYMLVMHSHWCKLQVDYYLQSEKSRKLLEMKQQGLTELSNCPWSSPVVLVKKKRQVPYVDYRQLNRVNRMILYPLPQVDDALEALTGMKWFSTLDLRSGYWQLKLDEMSKEKPAFSTGNSLRQFKVMPFKPVQCPSQAYGASACRWCTLTTS